jgi:hypothetical protein
LLIFISTQVKKIHCKLNWIGLEQVGEGKAHAAMAEVYELIGKHEDAIVHMESYLKVAEDTNLTTKVFSLFLFDLSNTPVMTSVWAVLSFSKKEPAGRS